MSVTTRAVLGSLCGPAHQHRRVAHQHGAALPRASRGIAVPSLRHAVRGACSTLRHNARRTIEVEKRGAMVVTRAAADGEKAQFNLGPASMRDEVVYGCQAPGLSAHPTPTSGCIPESEIDAWLAHMKSNGITRVIALLNPEELTWYQTPLMEKYAANLAVAENIPPGQEGAYAKLVKVFQEAEAAGEKVVVHCAQGEGRTGLVLGSWLVNKYGLAPSEAMDEMMATAEASNVKRMAPLAKLEKLVA